MRSSARVIAVAIVFVVVNLSARPRDQQDTWLVVHHTANLRAAATTQSAITGRLEPGDEVIQIPPGKQAGFHHVRTAAGIEGWLYQTLVHVSEVDEVPATPTDPTASVTVEAVWPKPTPIGSILHGPTGSQPCPADGEAGGDLETNRRKNRKDTPGSVHPVTFDAIAQLPEPDAPTNRKKWTAAEKAVIEPFEGVAVSVVGFIVAVKKQSGGAGEATNCHFNQTSFVDVHVALTRNVGEGERDAIVVEPTPRFYAQHPKWISSQLNDLNDSPDPVRITGWTLLDPVHRNHLGVFRKTLWEIHPVTKIEVFRNGHWEVW